MLGKLSWAAIPLDQPIPLFAAAVVGVVIFGVLVLVTLKGWVPYLWREWITSVDHKRIGVMYCVLALVMLLRGFIDAIMMRSQQALAFRSEGIPAAGALRPDLLGSRHADDLLRRDAVHDRPHELRRAAPAGCPRRRVPDAEFGRLLADRDGGACWSTCRWWWGSSRGPDGCPIRRCRNCTYSPGVGVDYYLWAVQISGVGTLLTGVNFVTTILKLRAPGMTLFRMPMFCWTALATNLLIVAAFPILTATLAMLTLDRYGGFHFFTNEAGGNVMMFMNLIWAWGHPEVYILILPAFGVFSEVVSTFARKPLFGYRSMVLATMAICIVSFTVWLHHFFTMGAGADVNAIFGIATMIIAVPTGVKIFNWLFTLYGGRIVFASAACCGRSASW